MLAKCHELRNLAEYEGVIVVDERIVLALVVACERVKKKIKRLGKE